jgi:hypothetical protein
VSVLSLENAKWLIGTLAIPFTLAVVAQQYQSIQAQRQISDARLRLYTELLSKREEADTAVRRGVFDKVLEKYLSPSDKKLQPKLVALDLLASNFHDSLDLSPLFWQLYREVEQAPRTERPELTHQLFRIADGVKDRQIAALELGISKMGTPSNEARVQLNYPTNVDGAPDVDADLSFPDPDPEAPRGSILTRHLKLWIVAHDPARRRVYAVVHARPNPGEKDMQWRFWIDTFDFPMVTFTRLSRSERFAVVIRGYENPVPGIGEPIAKVSLIYFPSARIGAKDKPFIDDVIADLLQKRK